MTTITIFAIVWQSSRAVLTRMLDGTEPSVIEEIQHFVGHVKGIENVDQVQARWIGHRQHVDLAFTPPKSASMKEVMATISQLREELFDHLPALNDANIRLTVPEDASEEAHPAW